VYSIAISTINARFFSANATTGHMPANVGNIPLIFATNDTSRLCFIFVVLWASCKLGVLGHAVPITFNFLKIAHLYLSVLCMFFFYLLAMLSIKEFGCIMM
jgi:hypothetical protein